MNVSRMNPMQAYLAGKAESEKIFRNMDIQRRSGYIHSGINLACAYMLLAMDAANEKYDDKVFLSKPEFKEFYQSAMENLQARVAESIKGEEGIDTYDIADLYCSHDTFVRKKYGLPLKKYDGRDEVL